MPYTKDDSPENMLRCRLLQQCAGVPVGSCCELHPKDNNPVVPMQVAMTLFEQRRYDIVRQLCHHISAEETQRLMVLVLEHRPLGGDVALKLCKLLYATNNVRDYMPVLYDIALGYNCQSVCRWMRALMPELTPTTNAADMAAINGYVLTLRWLQENFNVRCGLWVREPVLRNGYLHVLQYLGVPRILFTPSIPREINGLQAFLYTCQ